MSEKDLGVVIAIQIAPFEELENGSIEVQFDGADADTDGYGVYLRHENGMAIHSKDCKTEADAIKRARELCKEYGVKVEPYQWQNGLVHMGPDVVVDDNKAFEAFARKQPFIKDVQRYEADHPNYPNEYGHYDTKNARIVWDGAAAWVLAVLGRTDIPRDYLNGGDIRVVVEGRTGVGKSALCGIICEKLKTLGIPVTWNQEEYESGRQDRPWEVEFQELCIGATVRVCERNLVPDLIYKDKVSGNYRFRTEQPMERVDALHSEIQGHDRVRMVKQAIDTYVRDEMFNISATDPDRQKKITGLKVELCSYLLESGIPDEEKTGGIADLLSSRAVASKLVDEANAMPAPVNVNVQEETVWHRGKVTGISVSSPIRIVVDYDGFIQSHTGDLVEKIISFLEFGDVIEVDNKEKPTQIRLANKQ
ncbi:hypothetical protein [Ralstonia phage RSF1]|uniref:Uncharacterized protein n=1 Tax=Ralstonia phage RSF1 TaxID=1689679 RepID=A0A0K2QRE7_9CAUD|nr:hypothetical protein AVU11_gp139 [Ralstonia phage RSF1]BAS04931.1 hypothetical protein [Ralstonia phage RSF1]